MVKKFVNINKIEVAPRINAVDKFVKAIHKHIKPIHKKGINKVLILSRSYCFFARKLERYIMRESFAKSDG